MTIEKNKQVVIRFNKEFWESGSGEIEITKELLAHTFVTHSAPPNESKGTGFMVQFMTGFHKGFSDITVQTYKVLCEGDTVSLRKTVTATHTGNFMGKPGTGKKVVIHVIEIDVTKDSKITDLWVGNNFLQEIEAR